MDCFIDGFLIGIACALSPSAGIILGVANTLEMSFLGMAYATRLTKCTASSETQRFLATYVPPLIMFAAAGFGGWLVESGQFAGNPAVFIGFVAFAVVLLLALVGIRQSADVTFSHPSNDLLYPPNDVLSPSNVLCLHSHDLITPLMSYL